MDIAIVGAGAAGAGVAYALREADATVTVFEKSRGVGGRAATRRKHGCRYDHGANYVKANEDRVTDLVGSTLGTDGLVDVEEPVWTFDASGTIEEGRESDEHKWTYEAGITQLAKRLFAHTDATVELETRVGAIEREGEGWTLADVDGADLGTFDRLVLTPPAPQTAALLDATAWDHDLRNELREAVEAVDYRTVYSVLLHYDFELDRPWYALVNTDKEHDLGWLSREECKPGHVPAGESLLVAQMAPEWSRERYDDDPEVVKEDVADVVTALLGDERLATPDWTDRQGWRYALPEGGLEGDAHRRCAGHGLYVAGDWVVGEGRVGRALACGLDVGERLR
ncbi:NAD(P)/FAD-dependent oxidoreductase [Halomarina ordinaria]|uniref:NAD(P)/FAD-dependent oxidoreductase n=1 Tax=Halomarina ordinaria TaxID=3033939 RepID=A0ABD5U442_9EURY|nr:FAD-dependent oxidoreductase [Halomarina sp. PSRA2]